MHKNFHYKGQGTAMNELHKAPLSGTVKNGVMHMVLQSQQFGGAQAGEQADPQQPGGTTYMPETF